MNITRAVIIALNVLDVHVMELRENVATYVTPEVQVFEAINGSHALALSTDTLPLYTRHLIDNGRQSHVQIGNYAMLGCLLSHVEVWKQVAPGEIVAVFEEDAQIDGVSSYRLKLLEEDMRGVDWDVLKLDKGHLIDSGTTSYVGSGMAGTCADNATCMRWGTRGYLLRYSGAQQLLQHASPPVVQVDALISLLATYQRQSFRLYWATSDIALPSYWRLSSVWDGCIIQCFVKDWLTALLIVSVVALVFFQVSRRGAKTRQIWEKWEVYNRP